MLISHIIGRKTVRESNAGGLNGFRFIIENDINDLMKNGGIIWLEVYLLF